MLPSMAPRFAGRLDPAVGALRTAFADAALRQLLGAWVAGNAGQYSLLVTNLVIVYELGGPVAVGVFGLARYLTPTALSPFVGLPAARWPIEVVLRGTSAIRTLVVIGLIAALIAGAPLAVFMLLVAIEAGAGAFSRPLHVAALPAVAQSPEQLVAANVGSGVAEGLGTFVGPALSSLLLVIAGPVGALFAVVAIYAAGVASIARLHIPIVGRRDPSDGARAVLAELSVGGQAVLHHSGLRVVVADIGLQTFVRGLLTVLIVFASIELLGLGAAGVGTLNAVIGLGGFIGAIAAIALAGRERLGPVFAVALAGWSAPIAVIGVLVHPTVAFVAMAIVGISNAFVDVTAFTLAQRMSPNNARVAVMGLIHSVANLGPALGGLVAPALIVGIGIQGALIATGLILPIAAILTGPTLRRLDEGGSVAIRRVALLRAQPLFAPLSLATIEYLASSLAPIHFEAGGWLTREGDVGDRYILIDTGEAEVSRLGQVVGTLRPGDGLGEIALLHDVPRTASCQAVTPVDAFSLDSDAFHEAVCGHAVSHAAARAVADERLTADVEREG
jgi:Cyclic nucleotide-binding domain/Major Facilitator Superfamily